MLPAFVMPIADRGCGTDFVSVADRDSIPHPGFAGIAACSRVSEHKSVPQADRHFLWGTLSQDRN
jgi:hypothetical protein